MAFDTYHIHLNWDGEKLEKKLNLIIQTLSQMATAIEDLRALAQRQTTAIQGIRGDIQRLKDIIANNPNGINEEGVNELRGLFTANAEALEQLDAENTEQPEQPTPQP